MSPSTVTRHPTLQQFIRHAERFGPECVIETAREHIDAGELAVLEAELSIVGSRNGKQAGAKQRRTTGSLRDQVATLRERGLIVSAIADTLNVSDRRVRDLLDEPGHHENEAEKPLNQAEKNAAKADPLPGSHVTANEAENGPYVAGQIDIYEALAEAVPM